MDINFNNLEEMNKIGLNSKLNFNKYKGELVKDVVTYDANYIIYLYDMGYIEPDSELLDLILITKKQEEKNGEWDWEEIFEGWGGLFEEY